jgi:hypothetical protein
MREINNARKNQRAQRSIRIGNLLYHSVLPASGQTDPEQVSSQFVAKPAGAMI